MQLLCKNNYNRLRCIPTKLSPTPNINGVLGVHQMDIAKITYYMVL